LAHLTWRRGVQVILLYRRGILKFPAEKGRKSGEIRSFKVEIEKKI